MEPIQYAEHICKPNEWGGIPELNILSEIFQKEVCVIEIGQGAVHKFGSIEHQKVFLMYDGTHYNAGV